MDPKAHVEAVNLLLLLLFLIVQPLFVGVCARRAYHRSGILWGLLALGTNIGIALFFESRLPSSLLLEAITEVGTTMSLSTILILATLSGLRKNPSNLWQGLFRVWAVVSGAWVAFCAIEYWHLVCINPGYCLKDWEYNSSFLFFDSYFDVAKWFVGIPTLAFVISLTLYWIINGFRRVKPTTA